MCNFYHHLFFSPPLQLFLILVEDRYIRGSYDDCSAGWKGIRIRKKEAFFPLFEGKKQKRRAYGNYERAIETIERESE